MSSASRASLSMNGARLHFNQLQDAAAPHRRIIRNGVWPHLWLAKHGGEPGLLVAGKAGGTVVVLELLEAGGGEVGAPGLEVVPGAVAAGVPAFLVVAARIGAEEHAPRFQRRVQFA